MPTVLQVTDWILLTNDDGVYATGLPALARAISDIAPVRIVVPETERSWVGKAITRFGDIEVRSIEHDGLAIYSCSGYPADCTQLGINNLFESPPRLVVAGINYGYNHGAAYIQSSGTIGAVLEGALCGVDGIAFSAGSTRPWEEWRPWAETPDSLEMWERLAAVAADLAAVHFAMAPTGAVLSANLPDTAGPGTRRVVTTVAGVGYEQLFREVEPGRYRHAYGGGLVPQGPLQNTDLEAADAGLISISAVRGTGTGGFPDELQAAFEGSG